MKKNKEYSSFRDPNAYIYYHDNKIIRRIKKTYFNEYNLLMSSGLYESLIKDNFLISHKETEKTKDYIDIEVQKIPFISYPYEWCFSQLKDAALLTLNIEKKALEYNMTLKDASAYNIQFINGKPIFIDTTSFMTYVDGSAWGAYGQFCKHFLAPLVLMANVNESLNCLLKNYIDGIPLELAKDILKNRGGLVTKMHINLHSKSIEKNNNKTIINNKNSYIPKRKLVKIIEMLIIQIEELSCKNKKTEWENYYCNTNYDEIAENSKKTIVKKYLNNIEHKNDDMVWDIAGNDGTYSRLALNNCNNIIVFDIDSKSIERLYKQSKEENINILPLIYDINNPSPSIGFDNLERNKISDRGKAKCILALAIIHHICISNNVPIEKFAQYLSKNCDNLIIEFVPKDDSKVEKLLATREDIFLDYNKETFEKEFGEYFNIICSEKIKNSKRLIYFMETKNEK